MKLCKKIETYDRTIYNILGIKFKLNNEKRTLKLMKKYDIDFCGRKFFKHAGIYSFGKNNSVTLIKTLPDGTKTQRLLKYNEKIDGLEILISGNNNQIIIEEPQRFIETRLILTRDNNKVIIKSSKYKLEHSILQVSNGNTLTIGKDFSVACDLSIIAMGKNGKVTIGEDCMFSGFIVIRDTDNHEILDENANIINFYEDINIGNHVWVTHGCIITKGANIPNNSVLGIGSIYTRCSYKKDLPEKEGFVFAGVPAKVIRKNINWKRDIVDLIDKP